MFLRSHLMGGASRIALAPEDDQGHEFDDIPEGLDPDDADDDLDPDLDPDDDEDLDPQGGEGGDPEPRQSRGQSRQARLAQERAAEKARADRLEAELAEIRRQVTAPPPAAVETPQQRQARLAAMEPEDRVNYLREEDTRRLEAQLHQSSFRMEDQLDKMAFEQKVSTNPAFKAVAADVEKELASMRANNTTAPRETIATFLIGKRALEGAGRAAGKQRKQAAEGFERNRARPGGARSDVPAARGKGNESTKLRERLKDVLI